MVALCRQHHDAADAGAYESEQLREMKVLGRDRAHALGARFEWMRARLLAVVGGAFYYETPTPVALREEPMVWFNRDGDGRFLLNVAMPSTVREPRLMIEDNFWIEVGEPDDLECPPNGRLVSVRYANGDSIRVEFLELGDGDALTSRYDHGEGARHLLEVEEQDGFPVTAVEVQMRVMRGSDAVIDFGPQQSQIGGFQMAGFLSVRNNIGLRLG